MEDPRNWKFPTNPHSKHPSGEATRRSVQEERVGREIEKWRSRSARRPPLGSTQTRTMGGFIKGTIVALALVAFVLLAAYWTLDRYYSNRIYANVVVGDVPVGSLTAREAKDRLNQRFDSYLNEPVTLKFNQTTWHPSAEDLGMTIDVDQTVKRAMAAGRQQGPARSFLNVLARRGQPITVPVAVSVRTDELRQYLAMIGQEVSRDPATPSMVVNGTSVELQGGGPGYTFLLPETESGVLTSIQSLSPHTVDLAVSTAPGQVPPQQLADARQKAQKIVSGPVLLEASDGRWRISQKQLSEWVKANVVSVPGSDRSEMRVQLDDKALGKYLKDLSEQIDRDPQNVRLQWVNGDVQVLRSAQSGRQLNVDQAAKMIQQAAASDDRIVQLPVATQQPKVTGDNVQSLGINKLLGKGDSGFSGSSPERINNIERSSSVLTGYVVAPGDTFSFDKAVGEVSEQTGYQPELIGDNEVGLQSPTSGISQVSTTLFRAIWSSGLPILERHPAPYRVSFYEEFNQLPGTDAVVDSGKDLKFLNNTDAPIFIQILVGKDSMRVEIYGADQGWQVNTDGPNISNSQPATGGDAYWADPLLEAGKTELFLHSADGADVTISRKVTKDGTVIQEDHLTSKYAPTPDIYARGTKK